MTTHNTPDSNEQGEAQAIYVASRASIPERGQMWRGFRDRGVRITSSWIDEDGDGQTGDFGELWLRITNEIRTAAALVIYAETDDFPLKGAFIEAGIALGMNKPVIVCLPGLDVLPRNYRPIGSWIAHPLVTRCDSVDTAIRLAQQPAITNAMRERASVTAVEGDAGRLELIRGRVKRLEQAEKDPHVKDWSGAYYGDVYYLLGLIARTAAASSPAPAEPPESLLHDPVRVNVLPPPIVTRDGKPCEDQAAALEEFKQRCRAWHCERRPWPCRYPNARQCAHDTALGTDCPKACECDCHDVPAEPAQPQDEKCIHCDPSFAPTGPDGWCECKCHKTTRFKIGDRLRNVHAPYLPVAIVTALTARGFKYELERPLVISPRLGTQVGGESYDDSQWELAPAEPIRPEGEVPCPFEPGSENYWTVTLPETPVVARAVEDICAYFGDTRLVDGYVNAKGVAAIITRHLAAEKENQ